MSRYAAIPMLCTLLIAAARPAAADVVVLVSGHEVRGVVANREYLATWPEDFTSVAILPEGGSELRRIDVGVIHYVLLTDGDEERVVDFGNRMSYATPAAVRDGGGYPAFDAHPRRRHNHATKRETGIAMMIAGPVMFAVGVAVKFGVSDSETTADSFAPPQETYDGFNYLLMAGGAATFVGGLVLVELDPQESSPQVSAPPEPEVRVGVALDF